MGLSPTFQREGPAPFDDSEFGPRLETDVYDIDGQKVRLSIPGFPNIGTSYVGRAAAIFDSTRLADFSAGTFMPSAIPVQGEAFHDFGSRAMLQGSGSAAKVTLQQDDDNDLDKIRAEATFIAEDLSTSETDSFGLATRVYLQYNNLVVGITETAFADQDVTVPIFDLVGPNATATVLSPTGGSGQGRLSYYIDPYDTGKRGLLGNVSIEMPTPEIRFVSGATIPTTFSTYSRVPDFITTLRYGDGHTYCKNAKETYNEVWHVQLGSVFRDLGLKNGDKSIDDNVFGWGLQLSGATQLFTDRHPECRDAIGFSVTVGEGIGHYINDLHTTATGQKTGGNDAILNGGTLEVLPAQAYYVGYVHRWNRSWLSSVGYSHVRLDTAPGQVDKAYRWGDYTVVNLIYQRPLDVVPSSTGTPSPIKNFYTGVEYLFGRKETVDGSTGDAHRVMFVVNFSK